MRTIATLLLLVVNAPAADAPLGSAEFYPSAAHPVGERGDWTGVFPGAKDVALEWDHRTGKNIVWKCPLPNWSNSSPIVVANKVFVGSEPDELVCVDAEKGVVLWRKSVFINEHIPEAERPAVRTALREFELQALALDVPGLVAAQWVEAIKPGEDPAVAATAKRIAEIREQCRQKGLFSPDLNTEARKTLDLGVFSEASRAILRKHDLILTSRTKPADAEAYRRSSGLHAQVGFTMPTPLSDGTHVWYQTGLGAIACLDLDGKIVWNKRIPTNGSSSHGAGDCGSPILVGDRVFYTVGGKNVFAVEKLTGKEIWNHDAGKDGINGRGTAGIVPLRLGGRDFIQCPGLPILDAVTGNLAGKLPFGFSDARRGNTVAGDSVIYTGDMKIGRAQLALEGEQLTIKETWRATGPPWHCTVVYDGNVYFPSGTASSEVSWVPFDGKNCVIQKATGKVADSARPDLMMCVSQKIGRPEPAWKIPDSMRPAPAAGKKPVTVALCWQYAAPSVAEGHLFVGDDTQGMLVVNLAGAKSANVSRNFMDLFIRGNPFFQGSRMYVRSMHYLYCIAKTGG